MLSRAIHLLARLPSRPSTVRWTCLPSVLSHDSSASKTLRTTVVSSSHRIRRAMSSSSETNDTSAASTHTTPPSSSSSSGAPPTDEAGVAFEASVASAGLNAQNIVYIPFRPTDEWQVVQPNHILPPGLWIQADFEGGVKARLQPKQKTKEELEAMQQPLSEGETPTQTEVAVDAPAAHTKAAPSEMASHSTHASVSTPSVTPAAQGSSNGSSSKTVLSSPGPSSTGGAPKRGLATTAVKKHISSATRPILYPIYPQPSEEFLSARAPIPNGPTISIAPMVDVTDRHFRYLLRLISKHTVLYTPMLVDNALLRAPLAYPLYVEHLPVEHPVIAQLGGSEPETMVKAAKICEAQGFQQININCGCPAPSASGHAYGCILMNNPQFPYTVREIVNAVKIPVTVKCRIGLNKEESFEYFQNFIEKLWKIGGVTHFIVHARKAVLNLKTSRNLTVPPLKYDVVHRLKQMYPELTIEINGGFDSWDAVEKQIKDHQMQGVMLGRHAWKVPYAFSEVDKRFFGCEKTPPTRMEVMEQFILYAERIVEESKQLWLEYETKKAELLAKEAAEDALNPPKRPESEISVNQAGHTCSVSSSSSSSNVPHTFRPSELLPPPMQLDIRQLLRPVSYLYANEPGYKKFRALFEEALLSKEETLTVREICTRAMTAVEPPPPREEWPTRRKELEQQALAQAETTTQSLVFQGGDEEQKQPVTIEVPLAQVKEDGEACCAASSSSSASIVPLINGEELPATSTEPRLNPLPHAMRHQLAQ